MTKYQMRCAMTGMAILSLLLSGYLIIQQPFLACSLFSGCLFFWFLAKNPMLLYCKNISEIDEKIPKLNAISYFYGSVITFILSIFTFLG